MAWRTRQFLSAASRVMSGSSCSRCGSSCSPTTRMKEPNWLITARRTLVFSSSVSSDMTGSSISMAAAFSIGAANRTSTVASSTRLAELGSCASLLTTGKTASLAKVGPRASAAPAPRNAAATRTSCSWSFCKATYSSCSTSCVSLWPPQLLAMSAIASAHATRTRHDLSRTHFWKLSLSSPSLSCVLTRPQMVAVPLSALTRTDSCSSARSVRCRGSRSSSTRFSCSTAANSASRAAAARRTIGESSMPRPLQNVSHSSLPSAAR
mmetsp:Transcript_13867/g.29230  ORF Transcript_13867/g.29230 Transcript_13867/m.29230 type:complete len:266 (-) Transcript_13867:505-1302(-)